MNRYLLEVGLKQVSEVLDGVVPVLVERAEQLLETLLDPVSVRRVLVEGVGEAVHGELLALVRKFFDILNGLRTAFWVQFDPLHKIDRLRNVGRLVCGLKIRNILIFWLCNYITMPFLNQF